MRGNESGTAWEAEAARPWHALPVEATLDLLRSNPQGLIGEEARRRLQAFGPNALRGRKRTTALTILLGQFADVFVVMLLIAAAISVAIGETLDAAAIAAILVLNALVGFIQEYRAERAMEAMKRLSAPQARVLRQGTDQLIPGADVVLGDIVLLEEGDRVPADGRLLAAADLQTDESVLTGESAPVSKAIGILDQRTAVADRRNSVFMATYVARGRGRAVVAATGMRTEFGRIAESLERSERGEIPLRRKLARFAHRLGALVVVLCAIIFAIELYEISAHGHGDAPNTLKAILDALQTAVALAISAVPEGLPAVVTVSLALGARRLSRRRAIVRRLASVETLGAITIICADKTGTLTKGEMAVRRVYVAGRELEIAAAGRDTGGASMARGSPPAAEADDGPRLLLRAAALCTNARDDGKTVTGDTTECAILVAAAALGLRKADLEARYPRVREVPFSSERKRMTTVHQTPDGALVAYVKGAPEVVLARSVSVVAGRGVELLSEERRQGIVAANERMANQALRVLAVAYRELPPGAPGDWSADSIESDLVFMGLIGMIDPSREDAKEAIRECQQAGIRTVMITGDHQLTALAIAHELGMLGERGRGLTGAELDHMADPAFEGIVDEVNVYARVSPEHKLRIVEGLRKKGHVVAMTGDGVNDAPALKRADIGIAMGITGTDVTREVADMVIADDNFATIVNAVKGGRTIYDNIRKFSFFLLACNFDELGIIAIFALLGLELPLVAGMILWINLVTDGGPALALTMDPPERDVMCRPPRDPREGLLHGRLASILATLVMQFLVTAGIFYWQYYLVPGPLTRAKLAYARTTALLRATFQELFVVWNCRSERRNAFRVGFLSNKFLLGSVTVSGLVTAALPFTGLFGTVPVYDLGEWLLTIGSSLVAFLILPEVFYGRRIWRWS